MPSMEQIRQEAGMLKKLMQGQEDWRGGGILGEMIARLPAWARNEFGLSPAGPGGAGVGPLQGGGAGVLPGAPPRGYDPAYGGIPQVTDPAKSLENLIGAISGNLGGLGDIVKGLTGTESEALRNQYPDAFLGGLETGFENINRRLGGDISDLFPVKARESAEWAVAGGVPGAPLSDLHLSSVLGKTRYDVMRDASKDLAMLKGAVPVVDPFSVRSLVPDYNILASLQTFADTLAGAPNPKDAAAAAMQKLLAGLLAGRGGGGGGGGGVPGGFNFPGINPGRVNFPVGGGGGPPAAAPPPGAGWGMAWNPEGGFAMEGNVPLDVLEREGFNPDLSGPEWDEFFDLGIEEPFIQGEEAWWL